MSSKYIDFHVRMAVEPDKVDAVMWYMAEHLKDFVRFSGPADWVDERPVITGFLVDGNEWETPRYDV